MFFLKLWFTLSVRQNFCCAQEPEDSVDKNCFGLSHLLVDFRRAGVEGHGVEVGEVSEAFKRFVAERLRSLRALQHGRVLRSYQDDLKKKKKSFNWLFLDENFYLKA